MPASMQKHIIMFKSIIIHKKHKPKSQNKTILDHKRQLTDYSQDSKCHM